MRHDIAGSDKVFGYPEGKLLQNKLTNMAEIMLFKEKIFIWEAFYDKANKWFGVK